MKTMRYFAMFEGIGGFSRGIEEGYERFSENISISEREQQRRDVETQSRANDGDKRVATQRPSCVGVSEIDRFASAIYKYHYPNHKNYGDATKLIPGSIPDFDLLTGGFPCQPFSQAGKRKGFADIRGTLFFNIAEILRVKRPMFALLENVGGLVSHDQGRTLEVILETLQECGYFVNWEIYNSKNFGVPQNRERIFFICYSTDLIKNGHHKMTQGCLEIIKQWIFQCLLNNADEAKKRQGRASKDWVLGLCLFRETLKALGHQAKSPLLKTIWTNLFGKYTPYYQTDLLAESEVKGLNWEESESMRDGILTAMDENRFMSKGVDLWLNIELLLKSIWEDSYPGQKTFTTSIAIKQITESKTFTYSQMFLLTLSATVHLRNSFAHLWSEALSDLTLIQEGTNYARIHKIEEGIAVTESGRNHIVSTMESRERIFFVGHLAEPGRSVREVLPFGDGSSEAVPTSAKRNLSGTLSTKNQSGQCNFDGSTTLIDEQARNPKKQDVTILSKDGSIKPKSIASTLTGGGHSGGNHSDMDLIQVGNLYENKAEGGRVYSPEGLAANLNDNGGGMGAKTGLYVVPEATKQGYAIAEPGDSINLAVPNSKTRRGRVGKGVANTLETSCNQAVVEVRPVLTPNRPTKRQNGRRIKENGEPSFTLTSQDQHGVAIGHRIRRLTPIECERLQAFPDEWSRFGLMENGEIKEMSDSARYKCLGNAVTVSVIAWLVERILIHAKNSET